MAATPARFTGQPTLVTRVYVAGLQLLHAVGELTGLNLSAVAAGSALASKSPPWYTTMGLDVTRGEFEGTPVWTLQPANPSGQYVVALHGGGFSIQPTVLHWLDYANLARATGATVIVPIYPLVPEGTAATVVPQTADLISDLINQHGAQAVSVYGDSAGGSIALAAVQELVRRGDPTPRSMVLVSPSLDLTMSNPNISLIDDPVLDAAGGRANGLLWAGDLSLDDPLASPLFGSLSGLPPTWVYAGSLELLAPDVLRLQDKAIAANAPFTFILRKGEIHDWAGPAGVIPFTTGAAFKRRIYAELVGTGA
jgi:acetyl esterase/lipase